MIQTILIAVLILGAYYIQRKYYQMHWNENLDVTVKFLNSEIVERQEGKLQIVVENRKKLPLSALIVRFQTNKHLTFDKNKGSDTTDQFYHKDVFQVNRGERITRTLHFVGAKRGYYLINNVDLTGYDLFMSYEMHSSFHPSECIYVLPKPFENKEFQMMLQQLNGEMLTKRNLYEDPFELRGIREYQPFDSMKSINWKATAKTGSFMVNQKNYTAPKTVRIFLNMEDPSYLKNYENMELLIRLAASLVKYLLDQGIKVSFYCNGPDVITGEPLMRSAGKGKNQQSAILRGLARVCVEKDALDFGKLFAKKIMIDNENSYTCFISATNTEAFTQTICEFAMQGGAFSWFYPNTGAFHPEKIPAPLHGSLKMIRI